jgi:hypothetical protein
MRIIIAALLLVAFPTVFAEGYDDWKFGMTREEVKAVSGLGPYYPLPNNDLGSQSGPLENQKVPISFYFAEDKLSRMMLIAYQGEDLEQARKAWELSVSHLANNFEGIELGTNRGVPASAASAIAALDGDIGEMPANSRIQVGVLPMPADLRVWATFTKATDSIFMVAVNYASP